MVWISVVALGGEYRRSNERLRQLEQRRLGGILLEEKNTVERRLGAEYYKKEHTKPIFSKLKILTVQGLFKYHCISEIFKIIQSRCPYSLYQSINISKRDTSHIIILPKKSNTFLFKASQLWNSVHKKILSPEKELGTSVGLVKLRAKALLLEAQSSEIHDQWTLHNFQTPSLTTVSQSQTPKTNDNYEKT